MSQPRPALDTALVRGEMTRDYTVRSCVGVILCFVLPLLVGGCATTGDPRVDTIFFSETKAKQRLDGERRELAATRQQTAELSQENDALKEKEAAVADEKSRLALAVARVELVNEKLGRVIKESVITDQAQIAKLKKKLADLLLDAEVIKNALNQSEEKRAMLAELERNIAEAQAQIDSIK